MSARPPIIKHRAAPLHSTGAVGRSLGRCASSSFSTTCLHHKSVNCVSNMDDEALRDCHQRDFAASPPRVGSYSHVAPWREVLSAAGSYVQGALDGFTLSGPNVRQKKDLSLHKPSFDPQFYCQLHADPLADTAVDELGVAQEEVKAKPRSPNFCSSSSRSSSSSSSPSPPPTTQHEYFVGWVMLLKQEIDGHHRRDLTYLSCAWATEMEEEHHVASRYLAEKADLHWIVCGPKTAENSKRAYFTALALQNTTRVPREDPQEREERKKIVVGEGKKARNFEPPTLQAPPLLRGPTLPFIPFFSSVHLFSLFCSSLGTCDFKM